MRNSYRNNSRSRHGGRDNDREMHDATCADCGNNCKVPFVPSSDKPIYCSRCFEKHDPRGEKPSRSRREGRGGRDKGSRGGDRNRETFRAVCDSCKCNCEVPFRPSGDKPIYCRDCFSDNKSGNTTSNVILDELKAEIEALNIKMDEIIRALKPVMPHTVTDEEGNPTVEFRERKTVRAADKIEKINLK